MRFIRTVSHTIALGAAIFGAVSVAHAQAKGQPGAGQPGTGQPSPAQAAGGMGVSQTPWFNNPAVRQHLNLNGDQYEGLNKAYQGAWSAYQKGLNGIDPNATGAARQQKMNDLQQNFYNDLSPALNKYVPDVAQRQRYDQLHWQQRGAGAFADPAIADKLNLTQAQRDMLNQHYQDWSTQMGKLRSMYQTDPAGANKQFEKLQSQNSERINSVLTPQQQTAWGQVTGSPYTFSPDMYLKSNANAAPSGKK